MKSIITFLIFSLFSGATMANSPIQIYGYVEKATLIDKNLTLSAKLDTGAKSASLNATNITTFEVNGVSFLRFTVPTKGGNYIFESEYIGKVKIKKRIGEVNVDPIKSTSFKRPVVLLKIKLGDKIRTIKVNLTNRKRFIYPLLLGRDAIIAFNGAIDPAFTFTVKNNGLK